MLCEIPALHAMAASPAAVGFAGDAAPCARPAGSGAKITRRRCGCKAKYGLGIYCGFVVLFNYLKNPNPELIFTGF